MLIIPIKFIKNIKIILKNNILYLKREEIKILEAEKESIKKKIDVHFEEVTEIETKIKIIERKIVHPRNAFSTNFKESED